MESNDQITNTDEVKNHPEQSEESAVTEEAKTEIKTEIIPVEWVVGYFENENLYSVIPSNWLLNVNNSWYSKWPNSSIKSAVQARIINAVEPAKTWKYYPVEVIKRYNSYHEAEQETFSCLSVVDQDSLGRGKRKKKSNNYRHFDLSGDSDSESSVSVKTKGKPKKQKSLKFDPKNVASSSYDLANHQESCSSRSSSTNVQNNGTIKFECSTSNSNSSKIFTKKKKKKSQKDDDKIMSSIMATMDRIDKNLNELGKELIKRKVASLERKMMESKKKSSVKKKRRATINIKKKPLDDPDTLEEEEINKFDPEFLSNFPMTELDDIINLELRLVNCPEFKEMFISYINSIGGADIKNFAKRILSHTFTNRLSTLCTWRGYHGNFELQKLHMIKTMCDVSKSIFGDSVQTAFEVLVKEWFRRGKQRYSRQINTIRGKTAA